MLIGAYRKTLSLPVKALVQNLRAGFRLITFQRLSLGDFRFSPGQAIVLVGLDFLVAVLFEYLIFQPDPDFNKYAIAIYTFDLAWITLIGYLLGKWLKIQHAIVQTFIVLNSPILLTVLLYAHKGIEQYPDYFIPGLVDFLGYASVALVLVFIWRSFSIISQQRKVVTFGACLLVVLFSGTNYCIFGESSDFWYAAEPDYAEEKDYYADYRKLDAEALMYRQPALLEKSLATLKTQRKHHGEIYFVGFSPYAMQDVFSKEIAYAKALMDKRFDTQGRSINLVNHLTTVDTVPLATATNLGLTLKQVGTLMDKDEDVLVLYLTSHGSRQHELAVNFYPLSLNDLTPDKLKQMLEEAGIKWRVVIVSACYSGGYVKPLASPTTIVATAAAADKTSFGCSNENEFTYFGEALFKGQLTRQSSLVNALKQADIEIGKREQREGKEPSKPQLSVGKAIEAKLNQLEKTVTAYQCGQQYQALSKC